MTENQLRLLLSLEPDDLKYHEDWTDDWEHLLAMELIEFKDGTELPILTLAGKQTIEYCVQAMNNFCIDQS